MQQDGEPRDTGRNTTRTGTHGNNGDQDKAERMTTGMEGRTKMIEAGDMDPREIVGDCGR